MVAGIFNWCCFHSLIAENISFLVCNINIKADQKCQPTRFTCRTLRKPISKQIKFVSVASVRPWRVSRTNPFSHPFRRASHKSRRVYFTHLARNLRQFNKLLRLCLKRFIECKQALQRAGKQASLSHALCTQTLRAVRFFVYFHGCKCMHTRKITHLLCNLPTWTFEWDSSIKIKLFRA